MYKLLLVIGSSPDDQALVHSISWKTEGFEPITVVSGAEEALPDAA